MPPRPTLPGNPAGGPAGPGATPALSPGDGAGNEAASDAQIMAAINVLQKAIIAYPLGSKKHQALIRSISALTPHFNKEADKALTPSVMQQMQQASKTGGAMGQGTPPPGLMPAGPIKPPTMGAMDMAGAG
jgi:hypothetical protein